MLIPDDTQFEMLTVDAITASSNTEKFELIVKSQGNNFLIADGKISRTKDGFAVTASKIKADRRSITQTL